MKKSIKASCVIFCNFRYCKIFHQSYYCLLAPLKKSWYIPSSFLCTHAISFHKEVNSITICIIFQMYLLEPKFSLAFQINRKRQMTNSKVFYNKLLLYTALYHYFLSSQGVFALYFLFWISNPSSAFTLLCYLWIFSESLCILFLLSPVSIQNSHNVWNCLKMIGKYHQKDPKYVLYKIIIF